MTSNKEGAMDRVQVPVPEAWANLGMSAAVKVGNLVFLAGQVPTDEKGETVGEGDATAQAEQCFANIERILGVVGGDLADIVSLTAYLASIEHAAPFLKVRARLFADRPPATTSVLAQPLSPKHLLEIQVTAVVAG